MNSVFAEYFFLSSKLTVFSEIGNNLMRWAEKKHMFFSGNAHPKSNARAHLKQK